MLLPGALWFHQVSLVAPLANLIAIPWTTLVVVPGALLVTALAPMALPAAEAVALLLAFSMNVLIGCLAWLAEIPGSHWRVSLPAGNVVLAVLVALLIVTAPVRRPWVGFLPILLLPVATHGWRGSPIEHTEVHVLDVGHGLAALVLTPHHTLLVDTGGGRGQFTRLQTDILPHLMSLGRRRVDHLVISHADQDHSAGLVPLVSRQPDVTVHASDEAHARGALQAAGLLRSTTRLSTCEAGQGFDMGELRVDFLHPAAHDRGSKNDRSCVTLVHGPGVRVLFPGDIESAGERQLLQRAGLLTLDLLIAPHHGSDSSSTAAFVDAFSTGHVVFPSARRSYWGFPHAAVQMRYKLAGARLHHTGESGALVFRFRGVGKPPEVAALGHELRRLWRTPLRNLNVLPLSSDDASGDDQ